jgi:hypothetical protein
VLNDIIKIYLCLLFGHRTDYRDHGTRVPVSTVIPRSVPGPLSRSFCGTAFA